MEDTMLIQITNPKAIKLLHELEELKLIKVIEEHLIPVKKKISEKYRNVFTAQDAESFDKHTQAMRK